MKKIRRVSRAKFENIAYLTLNIVNMITFLMVFAASILKAKEGTLADIIQSIYCTTISFLLILHEFTSPAWTHIYFGFLSIHRGKALLMLFLGCLVMCEIAFNIIVAIIAFTIGFAYFILSLVPALPPPNGFLVHWQNHKDFWAEGLDLTMPSSSNTAHHVPMIMTSYHHSPNNMMSRPHNNNTVPLLHLPHPSAWHPSSSKIAVNNKSSAAISASSFLSPIYNTDYSKFQHHFDRQQLTKRDKNKLYVIY